MISNEESLIDTAKEKETGRIEAFSDGVIAIAITLLVLEIKVPHDLPEGTSLNSALFKQWPSYLAFVTSFITILVMWINHHRLFIHIHRSDTLLLFFNGLLLMGISIVPFTTSLVAEYLQKPDSEIVAVIYSGGFVLIAIFFNLLWRYASYKNRLLAPNADMRAVNAITSAYNIGPMFYLLAVLLGFFSVTASLLLNLALACFFALPSRNNRPL